MNSKDYNILSIAIKQNSLELTKKVLQKKDVCKESQDSFHLLVKALYGRHTEIARLLLQNGCKINSDYKTNIYDTPLHYALKTEDMELLTLLVSKGALINNTDHSEETALALAYKLKNHDAVKLLFSNYFDEANLKVSTYKNHKVAHFIANLTKNHEIAKKIIKEGMDKEGRKMMRLPQRKTYNLHFAADYEDIELTKLLVLSKPDITKKNSKGLTPLDIIFDLYSTYNTHDSRINHCKQVIDSMLKLVNVSKNYSGKNNVTHFHIACAVNNVKVVEIFLKQCTVDVNQKISLNAQAHSHFFEKQSFNGFTPLHFAAYFKCAAVIKLLLQHNVNIHLKDVGGFTPLQLAWKYFYRCTGSQKIKYQNIVEMLLSAYNKNNSSGINKKNMTDFHIACTTSNIKAVEIFIKYGLNIDERVFGDEDFNLNTPLHLAVRFNRLEVVKLLLKNKASVNAVDVKTRTPLYMACKLFQKEATKRLNFFYNECNYSKKYRTTINEEHELYNEFDWNQNMEIIRLLVEYGSDINLHVTKEPLPFLFYSSEMEIPIRRFMNKSLMKKNIIDCEIQGIEFCRLYIKMRKEIIKILVDHGFDVNLKDHSDESFLHVLLNHYVKNDGSLELTELFLSKGADPNAIDCNGDPILNRVVTSDLSPFAKLLVKYNVDVNSSHRRCQDTALHSACQWHNGNLKLLLDNGANVNAKNSSGSTPLHYACKRNRSHCRLLLKYGADVSVLDSNNNTLLTLFNNTNGRTDTFDIIRNHIYKLTLLNSNTKIFITDKVEFECLKLENELTPENNKVAYLKRCEDEINLMKSTKIDNYSSMYDIIFKNLNEMANYAKNMHFKSILNSDEFLEKFNLYGYLLELQLMKGIERESLLTPAKKALKLLTIFQLPDLCSEHIFQYLRNEDLKSFLKVMKTLFIS